MAFGWLKRLFSGGSKNKSIQDDEQSVQNVYTLLTRLTRLQSQRVKEKDVLQKISLCKEEGTLNDALDQTVLQLENVEYINLISLLEEVNKDVTDFFNTLVLMEDSFQTPELLAVIDSAETEVKKFAQMFGNAARNRDFVVGNEPVTQGTLKNIADVELLMSDVRLKRTDERSVKMHMDNARKQIQYLSHKWGTQEWTYPQMEADIRIITNDIKQLNTLTQNILDSSRTVIRNFRSIRSTLLQEDTARVNELNELLKQEPSAIAAIESARVALQNYRTQAVSRGTTQEDALGRRYASKVGTASNTLLETFRRMSGRKVLAGVTAATIIGPSIAGAAQAAYGNVNPPAVTASGFMQGQRTSDSGTKKFILVPGGHVTSTTTNITHVAEPGNEFVNFDMQHVVQGHFKFAKGDKVVNQAEVTGQFEQIKNDLLQQWRNSGMITWKQFAETAEIKADVLVQGGADKVGPDGINLHKYGQERAAEGANDIKNFFTTLGIKNVKINVVSSGEAADPVFANTMRSKVIPTYDLILQQLQGQKRTAEDDLTHAQGQKKITDDELKQIDASNDFGKLKMKAKKGTPQEKVQAQKIIAYRALVVARQKHEGELIKEAKNNVDSISREFLKSLETYKELEKAMAKYDGAHGDKHKQSVAMAELVRIGHNRADLIAMLPERTFEAQVLISGSFVKQILTPGTQEQKIRHTKEWAPIVFFMKMQKKIASYNPAVLPAGLTLEHTNWKAIQEEHNKPYNGPVRSTGIHIGGYGAKTSIPQTGRK